MNYMHSADPIINPNPMSNNEPMAAGFRSGIGWIELLDSRLHWIVILPYYKNRTNARMPASQNERNSRGQ
jgi:hypothetical protein